MAEDKGIDPELVSLVGRVKVVLERTGAYLQELSTRSYPVILGGDGLRFAGGILVAALGAQIAIGRGELVAAELEVAQAEAFVEDLRKASAG
jgi:hypothetical protein